MHVTINQISKLLSGTTFATDCVIESLMIDSRSVTVPASTLFVALRTPNNDGHRFIPRLIENGVTCFVVEEIPAGAAENSGLRFIVVDDTLAALRKIGQWRRSQFHNPVVAITGSRGKTTLKEMLTQALAPSMNVARSPRSFNSQIGVPLSLWQIAPDADIAIIEAGISRNGEMSTLEEIIAPQTGIITEITDEHSEGFGSRAEKIKEKIRLFRNCPTIIYSKSDPEVDTLIRAAYPDRRLITTDSTALHDLATAFLNELGYDRETAEKMLSATIPVKTRLNVIEGVNNCKLIFDEFTPDLLSLRGALDFMHRRATSDLRRTLIVAPGSFIGPVDSLEELAAEYNIDRLIIAGPTDIHLPDNVLRFTGAEQMAAEMSANDFSNEMILIKGTPGDRLDLIYTMLEAKQHETVLEVNLDAMISNFNLFRSKVRPTTGVICMLKAHGYGAGSVELARTLQAQGAAYIAVAVVDEGIELRRAGITMPIMVLNPRAQNHKMMFDYRLEPEIYSFAMLEEIIENARRYGVSDFPVHIKIETGMRRLGFLESDIDRLGRRLAASPEVTAATVFSHLACADDPAEDDYTRGQFALFGRCCDRLDSLLPTPPKRHILNSTGIIRFPEMQYDFVRLGIGLYGVPTIFDGSENGLRNVSTLSSVIISIKQWSKGDTVGYNRRGRLDRDTTIATVPIGYADGLDRHLGYGNAALVVNGHRCPTVGSICMDICMIDVTGIDCKVGDRVEVFGDTVTPIELADRLGTIPYEIISSISPRVKRVYYRE